ncbi:aspartate aminotransferase family protein [Pseudomonas frederiksbergensis]|uniref:Glutamate-1-semialdehyde 2,1-aminomutase n=1 Tax=Pseudomonas frederiksbergensis TaxID=104087 RepID=A0A423KG86_9PSED|nr:aminotransferase class III-fold pyridoxal phosphate-dependent enzyme [Pseudomonas frederiksbergensis]RON51808.1 aspartate aminotransferase family protein [Pseudomonas frederiksbergensis]
MANDGIEERQLREIAGKVMPAGSFGNMASDIIMREGRGGRVWDVSGNEYVDFLLGSGPMVVGHAHPEVNAAVTGQIARGSTFFVNNEHGIKLAAVIADALPCADQVRFASTGTEADAYAMRLARAYRKRSKILKFEGGYHGMSDYALMSLWPTRASNSEHGIPDSAGIPASVQGEIIVAPFNDIGAARDLIHKHHEDLAGVIVEPMQRLLPPSPGFLQGLRDITSEYGIVLIFDEVVTGFRLAYGGAQEYYGVIPDLCTLGKIVGGGYPLSAIAGREEIMAHFDSAKSGSKAYLPQIGTLSGNPIAAVAGLATLDILKRPGAYEKIRATGHRIRAGLEKSLAEAKIPAVVKGEDVMFDVYFTDSTKIDDYRATLSSNGAIARKFNSLLLERGVLKADSKFYISLAHDELDVQQTLRAFGEVAQLIASESFEPVHSS